MFMRHLATLLGLLIVFTATNVWAQGKPSQVCSLLTSSDISSVGATGQGIEGAMPISEGPSKEDTVKVCSWRMPTGGLHLSIAKIPQGVSRQAFMAKLNESFATLKAQGWTEEKKDFGRVSCELMTPPSGKQGLPVTTGCLAEDKGMAVSIATLGTTRVPMEKVKALVDGATARLP